MPKSRPLEERFWEKVVKSERDDCWLWIGATAQPQNGNHVKPQIYGKIAGPRTPTGRAMWLSHRLSWVLENGEIPKGMLVDHKCHNTLCVNPAHLRVVTPKQKSENKAGSATTRNSSGKRGVRWNPQARKWHAYYSHNRKSHYSLDFLMTLRKPLKQRGRLAIRYSHIMTQTDIKFVVVGHHSRRHQAEQLAWSLNAHLLIDEGQHGANWNHRRALQWASEQACRVVILEDDALPVDGFKEKIADWIGRYPDALLSFYLGTGRPPQYQQAIAMELVDADKYNKDHLMLTRLIHGVCYSPPPDCLGVLG